MQDVLHLGSEARMNTPSAEAGNWTWRYNLDAVHPDFATQLAALMEMTDRDGYEKPVEGGEAGKPAEEASKRAELGANV
jgi:4-alpha-glucanotransferase